MTSRRSFFQKSIGMAGALTLGPLVQSAMAEDVSDAMLSLNKLSPLDANLQMKNFGQEWHRPIPYLPIF